MEVSRRQRADWYPTIMKHVGEYLVFESSVNNSEGQNG